MEKNNWKNDVAEAREVADLMVANETTTRPSKVEAQVQQLNIGNADAIDQAKMRVELKYTFNSPANMFQHDQKKYICGRETREMQFNCYKTR